MPSPRKNTERVTDTANNTRRCTRTRFATPVPGLGLREMEEKDNMESDTSIAVMKKLRGRIPKKIRYDVWSRYFGSVAEGSCYVCNNDISLLIPGNYHCAHKKAHALGGSLHLDNLVPCCYSCNQSMGTRDLEEYKKQYYPNSKIIHPLALIL